MPVGTAKDEIKELTKKVGFLVVLCHFALKWMCLLVMLREFHKWRFLIEPALQLLRRQVSNDHPQQYIRTESRRH